MFIEVQSALEQELAEAYFSGVDFKQLDDKGLLNLIKQFKALELFTQCRDMCEYGLEKFKNIDNIDFIRIVLPILSSCYRNMKLPNSAIDLYKKYNNRAYSSGAYLTSIAAAYCDVENFEEALKCANRAYAIGEHSIELSLVYKRIKAMTK